MNRYGWLLLVATLALVGCAEGSAEEAAPQAAAPVRVAPVVADSISLPIVGIGTLGAKEEVALSFKVGGVVGGVAVDEGASVAAGQRLATLETSEVDAGVDQARSAAAKADRDLARAERLYADSVIALAQLEDATTVAEIARADLERALFNRRFAEIVAPAAGVVLRRLAEPGELVSPGAPVLVMASRERGSVLRVGLADRDVVRVRRGDPAVARFDALPGVEFGGTVSEIAAGAQAGTGTFVVEIALPDAGDLASGLVGTATIIPGDRRQAALVPLSALLEADGTTATVFVLDDGATAHRRPITIGGLAGDRVEIASGLAPGEIVVTEGAAYLSDGAAVEVVP